MGILELAEAVVQNAIRDLRTPCRTSYQVAIWEDAFRFIFEDWEGLDLWLKGFSELSPESVREGLYPEVATLVGLVPGENLVEAAHCWSTILKEKLRIQEARKREAKEASRQRATPKGEATN